MLLTKIFARNLAFNFGEIFGTAFLSRSRLLDDQGCPRCALGKQVVYNESVANNRRK